MGEPKGGFTIRVRLCTEFFGHNDSEQIRKDKESYVEVIIPDVLNTYDLILWAEDEKHDIITQRRDPEGSLRMLIKP